METHAPTTLDFRYEVINKSLGGSSDGTQSQPSKELRRLPENVAVDATYKTNSRRLALLHFVVAGTIASEYDKKQLATIHVAGCWMRHESNKSYEWAIKQFRLTVWPNVMDLSCLPNNFVTDGKESIIDQTCFSYI
ncbi:hypothetical protein HMPREF1544_01550 [Mucor circinelloides 1006PhL]|uniref:ZSWIM1/3 RNaseH-like domain-containing protein n=1 Tax=Mucor circinelloides f. circinelloides (strain 1006PhL) TaxID=1220926 RepID=S2K890_MUCC1|nr:hypothetical protein HMPREF1544_01550 [Mucor circinelloides 1006PhL]